ncbi:MAG: MFS transporter [Holophaga sp.]|nr:MFS transporter [Holophaga sp.]
MRAAPTLLQTQAPGPSDRRWALLALTCVGAFMAPLDGSIVAVALPKMGPALHLSFAASMWVQAAYLLAMAILLIPLGRMADQGDRLRYYMAGIAIFTLGSFTAALSGNATALVLSRIVQGAGGALLSATSTAIVTATFPPEERGRALGINVMAVYLGLSVGPPLGGLLVDHLGWPWIFLVNLPVGAAAFAWGWSLLAPRAAGPARPGPRADLPGTALLGSFLVCLIVPLTFSTEWGWRAPAVWVLLGLVPFVLAAFIRVESRAAVPLVDLDLLRHNRLFAAANLAALLNYCALYAISVLTAVQLQLVLGHPARITGWIMLGQPLMQAALSPLSGRLSDRIGSRTLATSGMVIVATGMVLLGLASRSGGVPAVVASLALVGLGMAAFSAPNTSAIMGSVERRQLSVASAFLGTMRVTGQSLSVGVLGSIAASRLGPGGWNLLLRHTGSAAVDAYAQGYRAAMFTGAFLALMGAWASLTRGGRKS